MPSIKKAATLTKEVILTNMVVGDSDLNITMMLNGPHGIGKSQIVKKVAKDLNGYCYIVEGGSLKEGEITGLPFAQKNADGSSEVRFIKYFAINKIWQLQKYYFEKACSTGFLDGKIKLEFDSEGNQILVNGDSRKIVRTSVDMIEGGEDNKYKFGDELDGDTKLELIESGEIKPIILFIDELNRTEQQTMKELMNIILNKSVNGYDIPWFVSIVSAVNPCSQNAAYATNELDDAQLDRFLKIRVDANLEDWVDYSLANHLNSDVVEAIAVAEGIFIHRDESQKDTSEMYPSPRSWEMVSNIYNYVPMVVNTKFFSSEERKNVDDDVRALIRGKVGDNAAMTLLQTISRKENNIKPEEILTMKDTKIPEAVVEKFKRQKRLTQKIIADNLANYVARVIDDVIKGKTSSDEKKKATYMNFKNQLGEFTNLLDNATQLVFVKKFVTIGDFKLFAKVAPAFSHDVLMSLEEYKRGIAGAINE